jgi:hypothetical protein
MVARFGGWEKNGVGHDETRKKEAHE